MEQVEPIQFPYRPGSKLRDHFEQYKTDLHPELQEVDFEEIRVEIALFYGVPSEHIFVIKDEQVNKKRVSRAFSVVITHEGEKYYVDGRVPHAILLRHLVNEKKAKFVIEETEKYDSVHGFLDPEGFEDSPDIQTESKRRGEKITWFVRYKISSPHSPNIIPKAPVESGEK